MNHEFYKLILITHRQNTSLLKYLDFIEQCVSSGVSSVQLREKNADKAFKLKFAQQLKEILSPLNIPLIINDDINLAVQVNADGVHLGQTDSIPQVARDILGKNKFIGLSIESKLELKKANLLALDYVAASAVFPTQSKNNVRTIWGLDGLNYFSKHSNHPVVGIGGINQYNLAEVIQAGAHGVAVIGALHESDNPSHTALAFRKIIDCRNNLNDK